MKLSCAFFIFLLSINLMAKDYLIFSVEQDLPMGFDNEIVNKNYYINMGSDQGLSSGTKLSVYRTVVQKNPYDKSSQQFRLKVGEVEIIHAESTRSIAVASARTKTALSPVLEIDSFMIGDSVAVTLK